MLHHDHSAAPRAPLLLLLSGGVSVNVRRRREADHNLLLEQLREVEQAAVRRCRFERDRDRRAVDLVDEPARRAVPGCAVTAAAAQKGEEGTAEGGGWESASSSWPSHGSEINTMWFVLGEDVSFDVE